jgi:hypothetical protein
MVTTFRTKEEFGMFNIFTIFKKKSGRVVASPVKKEMEVSSTGGHSFMVDITNEACSPFGFKHGDAIEVKSCCGWDDATVMGVAREYEWCQDGRLVLWYAVTGDRGRVTYTSDLMLGRNIRLR